MVYLNTFVKRTARRELNSTGKSPCEICKENTFLVQHHIRGRKIKNCNHYSNLANICSNCHVLVHKGEIIIENRVFSTGGYTLLWHKKDEESVSGDDASVFIW